MWVGLDLTVVEQSVVIRCLGHVHVQVSLSLNNFTVETNYLHWELCVFFPWRRPHSLIKFKRCHTRTMEVITHVQGQHRLPSVLLVVASDLCRASIL